jgi:nucleoside-diphosphate-sugar epimerase
MLPFVLADDVARGLVLAVDAEGIDGKSFNLVSDSCLNARDYVAALADATRTRIDAAPMPAWRTYLGELGKWVVKCVVRHPSRRLPSYRDWQTHAHLARFDCSEARRVLGWSSQVGRDQLIEEGVRKTVKEWLEGGH